MTTAPQNTNGKIGVFDSGIGGVTVLRELIKALPNESYIYYSDSAHNPYGDKTQAEIQLLSEKIATKLLAKNCKAIVIACNTASANAADFLREKFPKTPIIAIEPAYKMAHDSKLGAEPTLVLATRGTLKSEKFAKLYHKYDNNRTTLVDCSGLAELIENDNPALIDFLHERLNEYVGKAKNVVLGCTHYPLAKTEIRAVLGDEIEFFDGSAAVAKRLRSVLTERGLLSTSKNATIEFIDSSTNPEKSQRFYKLLNRKGIDEGANDYS